MKFNWVTFYVSDLDKSILFYHELLKLDISAKFGNGDHQIVMLGKEAEAKIELIYERNKKVENPGNGVSIGLETDNLDALIRVLNEQGFTATGPISPVPQMRFFFVKDPDGYTVQLIDHEA